MVKNSQYFPYINVKVGHDKIKQIDKIVSQLKFDNNKANRKYEVELICENTVYAKK